MTPKQSSTQDVDTDFTIEGRKKWGLQTRTEHPGIGVEWSNKNCEAQKLGTTPMRRNTFRQCKMSCDLRKGRSITWRVQKVGPALERRCQEFRTKLTAGAPTAHRQRPLACPRQPPRPSPAFFSYVCPLRDPGFSSSAFYVLL